MQSLRSRASILFVTLFLITACSPYLPSLAGAQEHTQLLNQIDQAEQLWQAKKPPTYHLVGQYAAFGTQATFEVTVKDGQVIQQSCQERARPTNWCQQHFASTPYTVSQLFVLARAQAGDVQHMSVTFDRSYGFPDLIRVDTSSASDDEAMWRITSFEATGSST